MAFAVAVAGIALHTASAGASATEPQSGGAGSAEASAVLRPAGTLTPSAVYPDGSFHTISPTRFYDSRTDGPRTKLVAGETRTVPIAGRFGVGSAIQLKAVAVNVTVDDPTAASFVSVFPTGVGVPNVSTVNFQPGRSVPNMVIVDVGVDGNIQVYNGGGQSHVILDVVGWFSSASGPAGGGLYAFDSPNRVLDTRPGGLAPFTTFGLGRTNSAPYAPEFATAVVNATVQSAGSGFVTFYPQGDVPPNVSNLNFPGVVPGSDANGLVMSNTVLAPLNTNKTYVGYSEARPNAPVNLLIDEIAAFDDDGMLDLGNGSFLEGSLLQTPAGGPFRTWDPRAGIGNCTVPPCRVGGGQPFTLNLAGLLPDPDLDGLAAEAVVLNVTIDQPTESTYLTVYPNDIDLPNVSTLNFLAGQTTAHATIVRVDPDNPVVTFFMPAGTANLIVDFLGHFEYSA
jgi:hypothetical protein